MFRKLIPLFALTLAGANIASADVLWSNRSAGGVAAGILAGEVFTNYNDGDDPSFLYRGVLEDGTFVSGAGTYNITGIRIGYNNTSLANSASVDLKVTFYDTVDYTVSDPTSVASGTIGSQMTLNFLAGPGPGETSVLTLPSSINVPDNNFGIAVRLVDPGTNTPSQTIQYLFRNVPVATGTSNDLFVEDANNDQIYTGSEILTWAAPPDFPAANLYLEIEGTFTPVPEPTSLGLIAISGLALSRRRR